MVFLVPEDNSRPQFLAASLVGLALMISQIIDGVVDPGIGYFADRVKSRWGKRKLLMSLATIPFFICMILPFYSPYHLSTPLKFIFLVLVLGFYKFFLSLYEVPYLSLIPEVTKTDFQRRKISSLIAVFSVIGVFIGIVPSGIVAESIGIPSTIFFIGLLCLGSMAIPCLLFPEGRFSQERAASKNFIHQFKTVLKDKVFARALFAIVACHACYNIMTIAAPYLVSVVFLKDHKWMSLLMGSSFTATLASFPLAFYLIGKFGKKPIMLLSLLWLCIGFG